MKATKTKRTRIYPGNTRPPADIRDNTKARRAWLADALELVKAHPNLEAKIIGKGSYQEIAVWQLTEVEGRLRHRGHCQYCGHEQVVKGGVLVLHGYTRPGDGYIFNECPGINLPPLEINQISTVTWFNNAKEQAATAKQVLKLCQKSYDDALHVVYGESSTDDGIGTDRRQFATRTRPRLLKDAFQRTSTIEQRQQFEREMEIWTKQHPEYAAYVKASAALEGAKQMKWHADSQVRHFETLLSYNYLGKPLREEVVT